MTSYYNLITISINVNIPRYLIRNIQKINKKGRKIGDRLSKLRDYGSSGCLWGDSLKKILKSAIELDKKIVILCNDPLIENSVAKARRYSAKAICEFENIISKENLQK